MKIQSLCAEVGEKNTQMVIILLTPSMQPQKITTEQRIKETARKVFLVEGKIHATTEDIGKAAGLPRTSIHYYFRTRDALFRQVFLEALEELTEKVYRVTALDMPFRDKIEKFIEVWLSYSLNYPYLDTFVITEIINQQYEPVDQRAARRMKLFLKEIGDAMEDGVIRKMDPMQFVLNLFALLRYPCVASPLYIKLFGIKQAHYRRLLKERKDVILRVLFP